MVFQVDGKVAEQIVHALNLGKKKYLPKLIRIEPVTNRNTGKVAVNIHSGSDVEKTEAMVNKFMFHHCKKFCPIKLKENT